MIQLLEGLELVLKDKWNQGPEHYQSQGVPLTLTPIHSPNPVLYHFYCFPLSEITSLTDLPNLLGYKLPNDTGHLVLFTKHHSF